MQADSSAAILGKEQGSISSYENPAGVLESFVRLIEDGEVGAAVYLLSSSIIERLGVTRLESIFSDSVLEIWSAGGIEMVDVRTLAFSRDLVEMNLTVWYGDHKVEIETVELRRENDQWKISLFDACIPPGA